MCDLILYQLGLTYFICQSAKCDVWVTYGQVRIYTMDNQRPYLQNYKTIFLRELRPLLSKNGTIYIDCESFEYELNIIGSNSSNMHVSQDIEHLYNFWDRNTINMIYNIHSQQINRQGITMYFQ